MPPMATATTTDSAAATRRFTVACGVLSQYVKAAALAPVPPPADGAPQKLTIIYGGRVVVLDGCTPSRAAELIRYAAAASQCAPELAPVPAVVDVPIVRKASLQRFLSKRKDNSVTAVEGPPYRRREEEPPTAKKGKTEASSWLALGSLGDMHAQRSSQHA